ncbi:hypothetical protein M9H77_30130 [Catharanthus roseus]|uniref:Uncharacterized protein n=1 Tax=Catharanthus roseus TaxID=4058 RepID=A0ACC0A0M2_CATRO|nr:hypothetical protein M9H77_30130 [Catharanthus roseus]
MGDPTLSRKDREVLRSADPSNTQTPSPDNAFQIQAMQQEFKRVHEVLANLGEKVNRQEENIQKIQSDGQMKTPSPIGRRIRIGEPRRLVFDPYEVEESEEDAMFERMYRFQLLYRRIVGTRGGKHGRGI